MERLQKVISDNGYTSRRKAEELIKEGKVLVNGEVATIGLKVNPSDEIIIDGNIQQVMKKEERLLLILLKQIKEFIQLED